MTHVIAALEQQQLFGRSQLYVYCLRDHGGAAEIKDSRATGKNKNKASAPGQDLNKVCPCMGQHRKRGEATSRL